MGGAQYRSGLKLASHSPLLLPTYYKRFNATDIIMINTLSKHNFWTILPSHKSFQLVVKQNTVVIILSMTLHHIKLISLTQSVQKFEIN